MIMTILHTNIKKEKKRKNQYYVPVRLNMIESYSIKKTKRINLVLQLLYSTSDSSAWSSSSISGIGKRRIAATPVI